MSVWSRCVSDNSRWKTFRFHWKLRISCRIDSKIYYIENQRSISNCEFRSVAIALDFFFSSFESHRWHPEKIWQQTRWKVCMCALKKICLICSLSFEFHLWVMLLKRNQNSLSNYSIKPMLKAKWTKKMDFVLQTNCGTPDCMWNTNEPFGNWLWSNFAINSNTFAKWFMRISIEPFIRTIKTQSSCLSVWFNTDLARSNSHHIFRLIAFFLLEITFVSDPLESDMITIRNKKKSPISNQTYFDLDSITSTFWPLFSLFQSLQTNQKCKTQKLGDIERCQHLSLQWKFAVVFTKDLLLELLNYYTWMCVFRWHSTHQKLI